MFDYELLRLVWWVLVGVLLTVQSTLALASGPPSDSDVEVNVKVGSCGRLS